jgi:hypothetical protein
MYAHRMVIGEDTDFALQYNLPEQLQGVPLEIIILPLSKPVNTTKRMVAELENLIKYNNAQNIRVSKDINIASLTNGIND